MLILGIGEVFASIGIWIVSGIYKFAAVIFEVFLVLADGTLFDDINFDSIIKNFYLVVGIIMLFVLAFSMLKAMVNPEDSKQGTSTVKKVVINLVTSAILMAILPSIFTFAYDFQQAVVMDYNPIGKFFGYGSSTGGSVSDNSSRDAVKTGAFQIVNGVFTAFFNVNSEKCIEDGYEDADGNADVEKCQASNNNDRLASGNYSFTTMMNRVENTGDFGLYGQFAKQVDKEIIDFNFLLSLIAGLLLIYVAVSYCFDMALRLVKLVFYQMIAPIPVFFRIMPEGKLSGTFNEWLKITITCYMEVFVRIFVFYFCIFLCKEMISTDWFSNLANRGFWVSNLSKALVLMGIITFMRQAPKLLSQVTGVDSGNMKLGIREKLAAGGAFTAGAILGGGITAGARNLTNAYGNVKNKFEKGTDGKWHKKEGVTNKAVVGSIIGGIGSTFAGAASGAARSGKAGFSAKSEKDMASAATTGAMQAVNARDKRAAYKASHGGTVTGVISGHISDQVQGVREWAGVGIGDTSLGYYATAAQATNSFNDLSESTYKKKQEYVDQSSKVKALKERRNLIKESEQELENNRQSLEAQRSTTQDTTRLQEIDSQLKEIMEKQSIISAYKTENAILDNLQISMADKKKDIISIAATKLGVDQRVNYSGDEEFQKAYREALYSTFAGIDLGKIQKISSERMVEVINSNGEKEQRLEISFVDRDGSQKTQQLASEKTTKIFTAMLEGSEVDERWIDKSNVKVVQDAIDQANIGRQHIKSVKEREHIVKTGNRPQDKKDKK